MTKILRNCFYSLKTGFGKYVGFDAEAYLIATADAIGARERFDVVCQDVILFLSLSNFLIYSKREKWHCKLLMDFSFHLHLMMEVIFL